MATKVTVSVLRARDMMLLPTSFASSALGGVLSQGILGCVEIVFWIRTVSTLTDVYPYAKKFIKSIVGITSISSEAFDLYTGRFESASRFLSGRCSSIYSSLFGPTPSKTLRSQHLLPRPSSSESHVDDFLLSRATVRKKVSANRIYSLYVAKILDHNRDLSLEKQLTIPPFGEDGPYNLIPNTFAEEDQGFPVSCSLSERRVLRYPVRVLRGQDSYYECELSELLDWVKDKGMVHLNDESPLAFESIQPDFGMLSSVERKMKELGINLVHRASDAFIPDRIG